MKKVIILILLFSGLNSICSQDTSISRFLPLSTGNVWVYSCSGYGGFCFCSKRMKLKIISSVLRNGRTYFVIQYSEHSGSCGPPSTCSSVMYNDTIRIDPISGNVLRYVQNGCSYTTNELIFDSLRAKLNDTIKSCGTYTNRRCLDTGNIVIFGTAIAKKAFGYFIVDSGSNIVYGNGFEIISWGSFGQNCSFNSTLVGCIINNNLYGDTSLLVGINQINSETPDRFQLSQNYPNPFNPDTKIRFTISGTLAAQTFFIIYDVLGREVAVLVNHKLQPGTYETDWNASEFPSGVYYYKLEVSPSTSTGRGFSQTKKMVLIK